MQLLTDKDMALLIEMTVRQLEDMKYLYPAVDRSLVESRLARLGATREYLSRVEFATPEEIESARDQWADDELQIDDDARVSRDADDDAEIVWVSAWVLIEGKAPKQ